MINRWIVQGSGIGPNLFTVGIIAKQPLCLTNRITKYADDASLLVPENCDIDIYEEFKKLFKWSDKT